MYKHVLVPVLLEPERDTSGALDVARLVADEGARITLLHVVETIPMHAQSYLPENFATERRVALEAELAEMARAVPGGVGEVTDGHASRGILDWAEVNKPDCIVIASHQPGMQDLLLGSTAAKVVRHATCAVHVIR